MGCTTEEIKKVAFDQVKRLVETKSIEMDEHGTIRAHPERTKNYTEESVYPMLKDMIERIHIGKRNIVGLDKLFESRKFTQGAITMGHDEKGYFLQYRFTPQLEMGYRIKNGEVTSEDKKESVEKTPISKLKEFKNKLHGKVTAILERVSALKKIGSYPEYMRYLFENPEQIDKMGTEEDVKKFKEYVDQFHINEAVTFIFNKYPELEKIGTREQYTRYLDTVFPYSDVRGVRFRALREPYVKNKKSQQYLTNRHIFFDMVKQSEGSAYGRHEYAFLVDAVNPLYTLEWQEKYTNLAKKLGLETKAANNAYLFSVDKLFFEPASYNSRLRVYNAIKELGGEEANMLAEEFMEAFELADAVIGPETNMEDFTTVVTMSKDQLFQLGSEEDVRGFEDFVKGQEDREKQWEQTPITRQVLDLEDTPDYGRFNYNNVVMHQTKLKEELEHRQRITMNMKQTPRTLRQTAYLGEFIRRLKKNIAAMTKGAKSFNVFYKYFEKDLKTIEYMLKMGERKNAAGKYITRDVIKNQTIDNLNAIQSYIETLENILTEKGKGMFNKTLDAMRTTPGEIAVREKVLALQNQISMLKSRYYAQKEALLIGLINDHLEFKYKDKTPEEREKLALKLYKEDIEMATQDLNAVDMRINTMDSSKKALLNEIMMEIFNNAHAERDFKETASQMAKAKPSFMKEMIRLGYVNTGGKLSRLLNPITYDLFFKRTKSGLNLLIQKFTPDWYDYKRRISAMINKDVYNEINKYNLDDEEKEIASLEAKELFNDLNKNCNFFDVNRIPEIRQDPDFVGYVDKGVTDAEAEAYKRLIISEIGEIEYHKMIGEQKLKCYDYTIAMDMYANRLKEAAINGEVSDESKDRYFRSIARSSPFLVNQTIAETNQNIMEYQLLDGTTGTVSANMQYLSYYPKRTNEDYYDKDFESIIESNDILKEMWMWMDRALIYINQNGHKTFNRRNVFNNSIGYMRSAIQAHMATGSGKIVPMLAKETLNFFKRVLASSRYQDPDFRVIKGGVKTVDEVIEGQVDIYMSKAHTLFSLPGRAVTFAELDPNLQNYLRKLEMPDSQADYKDEQLEVRTMIKRILAEKIMAEQETDLVDALISQMDMVSKYKAKREVETKLRFLMSSYDEAEQRRLQAQPPGFKSSKQYRSKNLANLFLERKLYGIDNTSNWFHRKDGNKIKEFGKVVYYSHEKEILKVIDDTIKVLEDQLKLFTTEKDYPMRVEALKEIKALNDYKSSMGRIVSPGSILDAVILQLFRFKAFAGNLKAQTANYAMGDFNARQVDGKVWPAGNYDKANMLWRSRLTSRLKKGQKNHIKVIIAFLDRVELFQNSANEIYKVRKNIYSGNQGLAKVLKSPTTSLNPTQIVSATERQIQIKQMMAALGDKKMLTIKDKNGVEHPLIDLDNFSNPIPALDLDENGNLVLTEQYDTEANQKILIQNSGLEYKRVFSQSGKLPKIIAYINGDYRDASVYWLEKTFVGKVAFMFKRWYPAQILKNFGVFKELGESGYGKEATAVYSFNAGLRILETGAWLGTIPMLAAAGTFAIVMGRQRHKRVIQHNINSLKAFSSAITVEALRHGLGMPGRMFAGSIMKSVQMIVNTVAGYQITNERVDKVMGLDKLQGEEGELVKQNLQFLMTGFARTLVFTAIRLLVHALLFPDDDEKKEYDNSLNFYQKMFNDFDSTSYYVLENLLTQMDSDTNMFLSADQMLKNMIDFRGITMLNGLLNMVDKDIMMGELTAGPNVGGYRSVSALERMMQPAMLDNFALGFNVLSSEDFNPKDPIDQWFKSDFQEYNEVRLKMMKKRRAELYETDDYKKLSKTERSDAATTVIEEEFPVIKGYFDSKGKIKDSYKGSSALEPYK